MITIPNEKRISLNANTDHFDRSCLYALRSISLIDAVVSSMSHQGVEANRNDLIAISSAPFCNYVYYAGYNQHEEKKRSYSVYTELISNYGFFESIAHFAGITISEVNSLDDDAFWKLVQFEILHDRPFITMNAEFDAKIVVGYKVELDLRVLIFHDGKEHILAGKMQGDDPVFVNWGIFVRCDSKKSKLRTEGRQKTDLLNWVVSHGLGKKEFFHETGENYAIGLHGGEKNIEQWEDNSDLRSKYLTQFLYSKEIAAEVLLRWAEDISEKEEVRVEVRRAAQYYGEITEVFSNDGSQLQFFIEALAWERKALEALEKAAQGFPSIFA